MKPYITAEVLASGKKVLAFQFEGSDVGSLRTAVEGRSVVAYAMPDGHSFQAAWVFQLILDDGGLLEFSSASTQVVGWQEVGSLNIRFVSHSSSRSTVAGLDMATIAVPALHLRALEKLVYEDADVISECALVLSGDDREEIVVAAGIPPGAVSVAASFAEGHFEPQFAMSMCKREDLQSVGQTVRTVSVMTFAQVSTLETMMKTDEICERYSNGNVGLTLRMIEDEDGDPPTTVLIEGSASALRMLAELLIAVADEAQNEGFSISPFGAGSDHFSKASELGVYIHRVPS